MCHHNNEDSRKHYANAFKIFTIIANVLYIIAAVLVLVLGIWSTFSTGSFAVFGSTVVSVLVILIAVVLLAHFNDVVQAYGDPSSHDSYGGFR